MRSSTLKRSSLFMALVPMLGFSVASFAAIEEVTVTAQKREQNLQDIPISISAFSSNDIEKMDITDVHSISALTPNLFINTSQGDTTTAVMTLRGANNPNGTNIGNENTVGIYFDGVYISKGTAAIFDLADIERIEVLRGPQGTLYGKNTIGGAINIISGKPTGEFGGDAKIGVGSDNLIYSKLSLNMPAIGTVGEGLGELSSKLTLVTRNRDGLVDNQPLFGVASPGDDFSIIDNRSGRLALHWALQDNLTVDFSHDWSRVRNTAPFTQLVENNIPVAFGGGLLNPYIQSGRPTTGSSEQLNPDHADIVGNGLTVEWGINDNLTLKSISSYRDLDTHALSDFDGTNQAFFWIIRDVDHTQITQEFQLLGDYENVNWIAGYYYFEENGSYNSPRPSGGIVKRSWSEIDNSMEALFGQVDWTPEALPDLTLTLGVRYSEEKKQTSRSFFDASCQKNTMFDDLLLTCPSYDPASNDIPYTELPELDYDNTSITASATWNVSDDLTLYARYAEGYRGGAYDGQTSSKQSFDVPYDTEELVSYEMGFKSQWLDNKIQLNAAVFLSDYDDLQLTLYKDAITTIENAGRAEIRGLEVELKVQPTEALLLGLNYGLLDPEYDEYKFEDGDIADVAEFIQNPENTLSATIDYTIPLEMGNVDIHFDYSWTDDYFTNPHDNFGNYDPYSLIEGYSILNGRISLADLDVGGGIDNLTLTLWGKNILDEEYITTNIPIRGGMTPSWVITQWGDPSSFGVEASLKF